ncbi:MAG: hypothetical protein MJ237_06115 [bacterium]|nr:hypothetical protein [bacterium]
MDCNIEKAKQLLENGNATKEQMESVLKSIVENYSTRPRIVIYLDDYNSTREEIINAVIPNCDCNFGYEPDFYTCCMEERNKVEQLIEELQERVAELADFDEDEIDDMEWCKERIQQIKTELDEYDVDYSCYVNE